MNTEYENHEMYVGRLLELIENGDRRVVGLSVNQYDVDDDISSITIRVAPRSDNER